MAAISLARGDKDEAQTLFAKALQNALEATALPIALDALAGLSAIRARQGDDESALALALAVARHPASTQGAAARAGQLQCELAARLTPEQVAGAEAQAARDLADLARMTGDA